VNVRKVGLALGLALWASGCGSEGEVDRPSAGEFDAFLTDYCGIATSCCVKLGNESASTRVESCKGQLAGRLSAYDRDAGAACLVQLHAATSDGSCWPVTLDPADPCNRVFEAHYGSSPAGGACATDSDCAVPAGGNAVCGAADRCQWQFPGKQGDAPCVATSTTLRTLGPLIIFFGDGSIPQGYICRSEDGVYCDPENFPTGGCVPLKPLGTDCGSNGECATGFCDDALCANRAEIGTSCNGTRCVGEAYCHYDSMSGTPVSTCLEQKAVGTACTGGDECVTGNCNRDSCSPVTAAQSLVIGLMCL
jgi:hypothetical protein